MGNNCFHLIRDKFTNDLTAMEGVKEVAFKFEYDSASGKYGYRDGADTFCPFNDGSGGSTPIVESIWMLYNSGYYCYIYNSNGSAIGQALASYTDLNNFLDQNSISISRIIANTYRLEQAITKLAGYYSSAKAGDGYFSRQFATTYKNAGANAFLNNGSGNEIAIINYYGTTNPMPSSN